MEPIVETNSGRVRGTLVPSSDSDSPVVAYRGIPYAAAPTGTGRFRRPDPVAAWSGVFDATSFGPAAVQSGSSMFAGGLPGNTVGETGEDCLRVCIWAPIGAPERPGRPVVVWIHGGAFMTGGSSIETYDGARLAATQDVIVVSIQYRLGLLGFAWVPGGEANVGLRDQVAALEWVHENIASFGGDPANITVMGESAGAGSVLHLLASPSVSGLVNRAILQSPGVEHTQTADHAERVIAGVLDALGFKADESAKLWELPVSTLVEAQEKALMNLMGVVGSVPFHPVVDGEFLPSKPGVAFAAPGLDLLVSWTADEMRLYPNRAVEGGDGKRLIRWMHRMIAHRIGEEPDMGRVEALLDFYRAQAARTGRQSGADLWAAVQTDALMRLPARRVALSHAAGTGLERATYISQFDWQAQGGGWHRGAFHAVDLPFTFATLDRCGWMEFLGVDQPESAVALAKRHLDAWGAFARTGNPGWDRLSRGRAPTMVFDTEDRVVEDPLAATAEAWEGLWSADGAPPA